VIGADKFLRIGHRGAAALEPANTLRSIRRALDLGVEMVEIDMRVSGDGQLVLAHDDEITSVDGERLRVSTQDLAALRRIDVGKGERIATLDEALAAIKGRALVNVDLKVEGQARELLQALRAAAMVDDAIVTGDSLTSFGYLKAEAPRLWVGLSVDATSMSRTQAWLEQFTPDLATRCAALLASRAVAAHADALMLEHAQISAALVRALHQRTLRVYVWTVDRTSDMVRLKAQGVDGVTSNRVDVLVRVV
jgi:glycerophosphoryl diester phosphodiesterase